MLLLPQDFICATCMNKNGVLVSWFITIKPNMMVCGQLSGIVYGRCSAQILAIPTDAFCCFLQSLQESVETVCRFGHVRLLPKCFQFVGVSVSPQILPLRSEYKQNVEIRHQARSMQTDMFWYAGRTSKIQHEFSSPGSHFWPSAVGVHGSPLFIYIHQSWQWVHSLWIAYIYMYLYYSTAPVLKINSPSFLVICKLFMFPLFISLHRWRCPYA
jgi:hypothetical protein